jgi:NADH-quinone oxidoreductase subunit L
MPFLAVTPSAPTISEGVIWAIIICPLAGFALCTLAVLLRSQLQRFAGYVAVATVGAAFVLAMVVLFNVIDAHGGIAVHSHTWYSAGPLKVPLGVRVDGLAAIMLSIVTSVSLLVQVYSLGYMHGDRGYGRYFAYMCLFTTSMLGLVLADNIFMIFIFWELVGLCSYLLIGFWFHRPSAAAAAKKAFVITRLGDLGFMAAIFLIWTRTGELGVAQIQAAATNGAISGTLLTLFALGIFAGAVGKSAQFPLHVWLPDAMEGPTPISALIHAATMVAAGVYLVARFYPVFEASTDAMQVVMWIGAATALIAATIALVQTDIKRVLAYSTISQLGYMVLALGGFGYVAAIFHLFTHAFFKALLFLGSGSVNHSTNTFDMRKMGGLWKRMPITFWTFVIASLSISGIFPLAGFWSKDEVLHAAWDSNHAVWVIGIVVAFMTALYMFRAVFLTFFGEYKGGQAVDHDDPDSHFEGDPAHPHEAPWTMALPLIILAIPAVLAGFANINNTFGDFIIHALPGKFEEDQGVQMMTAVISVVLALLGIAVAYVVYYKKWITSESLHSAFLPFAIVLERKYFLDDLYESLFSKRIFQGGWNRLCDLTDRYVVDGLVNGVGLVTDQLSTRIRVAATGQLQTYGAMFALGVIVVVAIIFAVNPV